MATFRVGVGSFNINDGAVGIGTEISGLGNLGVEGTTKVIGSKVSGASTLTRYSGFAADNINQLENITLTSEVGTIGDIVVGVGTSVIISSASTVTVGTVESVSIGTHFSPPKGGIEERGQDFVEGMMRFNTDLNTMEFYNGNEWKQFTYIADIQNSPGSRGRAIVHLGSTPSASTTLDFFNISTFGNSQSFGNLTAARYLTGRSSSETRGLFAGGDPGPSNSDIIDYITMASSGNAIDFGNLTASGRCPGGASSSTRAIFAGVNSSNVISYVEINTLGDALDFGDLTNVAGNRTASFSSPTRFVCMSGHSSPNQGAIDFLNIASKGNTVRFGNLTYAGVGYGSAKMNRGLSNSIRGLFAGGYQPNSPYPVVSFIDYVTIASEGNATNFGDMTSVRYNNMTTGSQTRGILAGGQGGEPSFTREKTIDSVEYATTGTAVHFGELSEAGGSGSANSDCHGGLGGY